MRIAIVDTLYPAFVAEHYARRPGLASASYDEQHAALIARCFGTSDAYSTGLTALGHDARELIVNCEPLQLAWARERGVRMRRLRPRTARFAPGRVRQRLQTQWLGQVARAQIAALDADVVYCQDLSVFTADDVREMRAEGRLVVGQIAAPLPDDGRLRAYSLLLSSFPHFVTRFRAMGIPSEYLRLAFDARILDRLRAEGVDPAPDAPARHGAAFVGGINPAVHGEGVALLERLLGDIDDLTIRGYGADQLPAASPVRQAWSGEAWGLEMYAALARAGIALNRHISVAEGVANNMRLYEATGVGAMLVTEAAPNLADLFAPGEEVVTYQDYDELVAQVRRYLRDDEARRTIAAAGQARTLSEHSYAVRTRELAEILASFR